MELEPRKRYVSRRAGIENAKAYDGSRSLGYYAKQVGARSGSLVGLGSLQRHKAERVQCSKQCTRPFATTSAVTRI